MSAAFGLLRRRPQFRSLWAALALSYSGSGAAMTALVLYVQQTHGTGTAVAALLFAETAPKLLGPLAGSLVDRVDPRRLMIGADLGQACFFAALAVLPPFGVLIALTVGTAFLQTAYGPARTTVVPALVEPDELLGANALVGIATNLFVAVGPLVGGVVFAVAGTSAVMLINVATFLGSALLTRRIPAQAPGNGEDSTESFLAATRSGIRFAMADPLIRTVTLTTFAMFATIAVDNVALVFLVRDTLGGGAAAYGLVSALFGLGMVAASLTITRATSLSTPRLFLVGIGLSAAGTLLTGLAPVIALVGLVQLVAGSGNGIEMVASETILHQYVPRQMLGRIYGVTSTAIAAGLAISMGLGGFLVDATSPRTAFLLAGASTLVVTAAAAPGLLRARAA